MIFNSKRSDSDSKYLICFFSLFKLMKHLLASRRKEVGGQRDPGHVGPERVPEHQDQHDQWWSEEAAGHSPGAGKNP